MQHWFCYWVKFLLLPFLSLSFSQCGDYKSFWSICHFELMWICECIRTSPVPAPITSHSHSAINIGISRLWTIFLIRFFFCCFSIFGFIFWVSHHITSQLFRCFFLCFCFVLQMHHILFHFVSSNIWIWFEMIYSPIRPIIFHHIASFILIPSLVCEYVNMHVLLFSLLKSPPETKRKTATISKVKRIFL